MIKKYQSNQKTPKTTQTTKPNKNWVIWAHEIYIFCSETVMGATVIAVIVVTNLFFEYLVFRIQFLIFLMLCFLYVLCFFCTVLECPDPDLTENSWSCIPVVNRKLWVERLLWERSWRGASCRVCCLAGNESARLFSVFDAPAVWCASPFQDEVCFLFLSVTNTKIAFILLWIFIISSHSKRFTITTVSWALQRRWWLLSVHVSVLAGSF